MLVLASPAKVNLFLRILGKRPDGYHELASLFYRVDHLSDELTLSLAEEDSFVCDHPAIPPENLVTAAVALFRRKTGRSFPVALRLQKRIPLQAGLGGGSSNAATTLKGLNLLCGSPYTEKELQAWSAELGSDVPFFFSSGAAYCTGRGERVRDLPHYQFPYRLSLHTPPEGLSTARVYQELRPSDCAKVDPEELLSHFLSGNPHFVNDLEAPAFRLLPQLAMIKREKPGAVMSGSGSTFFIPR